MDEDTKLGLWSYRYNTARGHHWKLERVCLKEDGEPWKEIFSKDEPGIRFELSQRNPRKTYQILFAQSFYCAMMNTSTTNKESNISNVTIRCNNVSREIIAAHQLTEKERQEFDYIDWETVDSGNNCASFFRYKGDLYHLEAAMYIDNQKLPSDSFLKGWRGCYGESDFSGVLVKYAKDFDSVIVGQYFS